MKHVASMSVVVGSILAWTHVVPVAAAANRSGFDGEVRDVLSDKALAKGKASVVVARLTAQGAQPVFSSNGTLPLMPASNQKVVTTSAAMAILGPDFRFHTQVYLRDGDLYIVGDGDPTIGDPDLVEKIGWQYDTVFNMWAEKVAKAGVTTVRNVYVDDSIFDQEFVHGNWPTNQLDRKYVAQVSGFSFYANTIDLRVVARGSGTAVETTPPTSYVKITNGTKPGAKNAVVVGRGTTGNDLTLKGEVPRSGSEAFSTTIQDPALYGATCFLETLRKSGIQVTGGVARASGVSAAAAADPAKYVPVAALDTPLATVLARCNKDSANLYAESVAKRIAAKASGKSGSWEGSRGAVGAWLTRIGVPADEFELDDGCGLSRGNHISANAIVKILAADFAAPYRQAYIDSLAVGGVDGTLSKRFGDNLKGRVHAKTGYIDGVSNLSGYLEARNGQWYCFSILFNQIPGGVKPLHERIVKAIDDDLP
jgi:D-alanyl-D-alanine carboxypeptidase/D-alanyl-D-alanine-endopeptidase (penicillin-binding protein 4)